MTFQTLKAKVLTFLGLANSIQNPNKYIPNNTSSISLIGREVFTLYKKTDTLVYIARALVVEQDKFDMYLYEIDMSVPEEITQQTTLVQQLSKDELEKKKSELQVDYNWKPSQENAVLFIQIQRIGFKTELQLLYKRHNIEDKLDKALESRQLGEWFAGDLGTNGANMLYYVVDVEEALQIVLKILQRNKLDKKTIIGRRVLLDVDDWFYEVIYPANFSGNFNTM